VDKLTEGLFGGEVVPIFRVSNVTGEGMMILKSLLPKLKSRVSVSGEFKTASDPVEFVIDGDYMVTGVGLVVAGTLKAGTVVIG